MSRNPPCAPLEAQPKLAWPACSPEAQPSALLLHSLVASRHCHCSDPALTLQHLRQSQGLAHHAPHSPPLTARRGSCLLPPNDCGQCAGITGTRAGALSESSGPPGTVPTVPSLTSNASNTRGRDLILLIFQMSKTQGSDLVQACEVHKDRKRQREELHPQRAGWVTAGRREGAAL